MRTTRTFTRTVSAAVSAAVLAVTLAACGDSDAQPSQAAQTAPNGDVFDDADVQFATEMIPHHAQAVQMVEMTRGRQLDPPVAELADAIRTAQVPEVETMGQWLTGWGKDIPATSLDHANAGHDMSDMHGMSDTSQMPGMMSETDMKQLESAPDDEFQDMWLQMMIEHHQGAIDMAQTEEAEGRFPAALDLAKRIEKVQQAEISQMEQLLGS